jgi:hypothetical protein
MEVVSKDSNISKEWLTCRDARDQITRAEMSRNLGINAKIFIRNLRGILYDLLRSCGNVGVLVRYCFLV